MRYVRNFLGTVSMPWHPDFSFDQATFRKSVRVLVSSGMRDLYLFATAGEGYAVTVGQFRQVTEAFADEHAAAGGIDPMIGVVGISLATSLKRVGVAHSLGLRDFQFSLPPWSALTGKETTAVFVAFCDGFPDSRCMHYSLARSGRIVSPRAYGALAVRREGLVATKYGASEPNQVVGMLREAPQLHHFFTQNGCFLGAALGECGFIASVASSNPVRARVFVDAGASGDMDRPPALYAELSALSAALATAIGPGRIDGTHGKVIHQLANPAFPLRLLPPFEGSTDAEFESYRQVMRQQSPQWLPSP